MAGAMSPDGKRSRNGARLAVLSHGYRPFFFLAALFAAGAVPAWIAAFGYGVSLGHAGNPLGWHAHEMLYGYLSAVLAGFLMTAIPNWTGRLPIAGRPLVFFVALWLAGRVAMLCGGQYDPDSAWPPAADALFLIVLAAFVWREVLTGKNWRNLPVCVLVSLFAAGNVLWHAEAVLPSLSGVGLRLGLGVAVMLMALVGGRIIPSFTVNWLKKRHAERLPAPFGRYDKAVLAWTGLTVLAWIFVPDGVVTGSAFAAAGVLHAIRLARWRGWATLAEPLLVVLHVAYLWLPVAFLLMGLAALAPAWADPTTALHALTAGAIGLLTMAVMTRASLGHSGRELIAGAGTASIYVLIWTGAALRVAAPYLGLDYVLAVSAAGVLWAGGFALFAILYAPVLFGARPAAGG